LRVRRWHHDRGEQDRDGTKSPRSYEHDHLRNAMLRH
jgi:hypothetical protein